MSFLYSQLFVTPMLPSASFAGQTIIVTGSNVGLGKEAARHFARLGASEVIMAIRNVKAGEEAKKDIETSTKCGAAVIEVWSLDLSSYESVKSFAHQASKLTRLDILLENAGIVTTNFSLAEGHERTITVNVISTFFLALLMLPKLKSSGRQFGTKLRLTIVSSESKARMSERYPTGKLLEVLVVRQIAPEPAGSGVSLNMLNPGLCLSELSREVGMALAIIKFFLARTTEVCSRTLVAAAAAGQESYGKYMHDGQVDDSLLSDFVKSQDDGKKASEKAWKELSEILGSIQPGITNSR